jgi:hypothetical protein
MAKQKGGSQTGNLTPNHKKSGINLTPVRAGRVRHTLESSWQELQLALDLIQIGGLSKEL